MDTIALGAAQTSMNTLLLLASSSLGTLQPNVAWLGLEAIAAIFVASLLGSVHCIGMCGPFLALATGNSPASNDPSALPPRRSSPFLQIPYHLGRLTTYLLLGVAAGTVARILGVTLERINAPQWLTAGGIAGATLLSIGVWRSLESGSASNSTPEHRSWRIFHQWGSILSRVRKRFQSRSRVVNAYLWGFFTTLLPCGWLYLFVIAAIASPNILWSTVTMLAFWLGTIPALGFFAALWHATNARVGWLRNPLTSCVILGLGLFLMFSRSTSLFTNPNDTYARGFIENNNSAEQLTAPSSIGAIQNATSPRTAPPSDPPIDTASLEDYLIRLRQSINSGLPHCGPINPTLFPISTSPARSIRQTSETRP